MRKPTALVGVAVLFAIAWYAFPEHVPDAVGQVRVEIPNAAAKADQKWEYETFSALKNQLTGREFSLMGKEGWEFCQAIPGDPHTVVVFKRPLK
jgi:hypothetical protein